MVISTKNLVWVCLLGFGVAVYGCGGEPLDGDPDTPQAGVAQAKRSRNAPVGSGKPGANATARTSSTTGPTDSDTSHPDTSRSAPPAPGSNGKVASPRATVSQFLTALKAGDEQAATAMLTDKAQQEMSRTDAAILPPGSPSATFRVVDVEYVGQQRRGARVLSVWRDLEDGQATEHEIVWLLRRQQQSWAVAGFATKVFADKPPLILNFEDPLDLQRKRAAVDAEIARRTDTSAGTPVQQAQQPAAKPTIRR